MFKKRRGIHIPYNKQGLIYFTCVNYRDLPDEVVQKITRLCDEIGKEHALVLFEVVTNSSKSIRALAMDYHISEMSLYRYRKKFYEAWENETKKTSSI